MSRFELAQTAFVPEYPVEKLPENQELMEKLVFHLVNVVAPVLPCVLIGFGLAKTGLSFDKKTVGALVANVGYPTLILSHLTKQHVALAPLLRMMLAAVAAITCFGLIGFDLLKLLRLPVRGYLSPMMLNNVGNVGLPVCALGFGTWSLHFSLGSGFLRAK